ncbi:hypothetical protein, partial [Saccharopolyspora shandongensis]
PGSGEDGLKMRGGWSGRVHSSLRAFLLAAITTRFDPTSRTYDRSVDGQVRRDVPLVSVRSCMDGPQGIHLDLTFAVAA